MVESDITNINLCICTFTYSVRITTCVWNASTNMFKTAGNWKCSGLMEGVQWSSTVTVVFLCFLGVSLQASIRMFLLWICIKNGLPDVCYEDAQDQEGNDRRTNPGLLYFDYEIPLKLFWHFTSLAFWIREQSHMQDLENLSGASKGCSVLLRSFLAPCPRAWSSLLGLPGTSSRKTTDGLGSPFLNDRGGHKLDFSTFKLCAGLYLVALFLNRCGN